MFPKDRTLMETDGTPRQVEKSPEQNETSLMNLLTNRSKEKIRDTHAIEFLGHAITSPNKGWMILFKRLKTNYFKLRCSGL